MEGKGQVRSVIQNLSSCIARAAEGTIDPAERNPCSQLRKDQVFRPYEKHIQVRAMVALEDKFVTSSWGVEHKALLGILLTPIAAGYISHIAKAI